MKRTALLAATILALLATACSSSDSGDATTSTASTTTGGGDDVNGCTTFEDHHGEASVVVAFGGGAGLKYDPACIQITAGTKVTFQGDFSGHPLSGGAPGSPDASSPIPATSSGDTLDVTFDDAGDYGYFCTIHGSSGMQGAVRVEN